MKISIMLFQYRNNIRTKITEQTFHIWKKEIKRLFFLNVTIITIKSIFSISLHIIYCSWFTIIFFYRIRRNHKTSFSYRRIYWSCNIFKIPTAYPGNIKKIIHKIANVIPLFFAALLIKKSTAFLYKKQFLHFSFLHNEQEEVYLVPARVQAWY